MLNQYLKQGLAISALSLSFAAQAADANTECDPSLMACGIKFSAYPSPTAPSGMAAGDTVSAYGPYTITNVGGTPVTLSSVAAVRRSDDTVGPGVVSIDPSSTCQSSTVLTSSGPSQTCNIYLDFAPNYGGLLDWNLVVTPISTQRPLSLQVTTTVTGPTPTYGVVGGIYNDSSSNYYPLLSLTTDGGSTWNYVIDSTTLGGTSPSGYNPANTSLGVLGTTCSARNCAAAGQYGDGSGNSFPFIAANGGTAIWSYPVDKNLVPGDFITLDPTMTSTNASCSAALCMAVMTYDSTVDESTYGLAYASVDGGASWTIQFDSADLPAYAAGHSLNQTSLNGVECSGSRCIAVGFIAELYYPNNQYPFIAYSDDGGHTWQYPNIFSQIMPSLTDFSSSGTLLSVSCTGSRCVAAGNYQPSSVSLAAPLVVQSLDQGQTWSVVLASNAITPVTPSDFWSGQMTAVDCSSQACLAVGEYYTSSFAAQYPFAVLALASGSWTWSSVVDSDSTLPTNMSPSAANVSATGANCTGAICQLSGYYIDNTSTVYPFIGVLNAGSLSYPVDSAWAGVIGNTAPNAYEFSGNLVQITCSGSFCASAGYYQASYAGANNVPLLMTSTNTGIDSWNYVIYGDVSNTTLPSDLSLGQFNANVVDPAP